MTADWLAHELQDAFQTFEESLVAAVKRAVFDALQSTASTATGGLTHEATAGASSNGLHAPARARGLSPALCARIVELVHERPGISARQVARGTGMHIATIRRYLHALIDARLLRTEPGHAEAPGRPERAYFKRDGREEVGHAAAEVDATGEVDAAAEVNAGNASEAGAA